MPKITKLSQSKWEEGNWSQLSVMQAEARSASHFIQIVRVLLQQVSQAWGLYLHFPPAQLYLHFPPAQLFTSLVPLQAWSPSNQASRVWHSSPKRSSSNKRAHPPGKEAPLRWRSQDLKTLCATTEFHNAAACSTEAEKLWFAVLTVERRHPAIWSTQPGTPEEWSQLTLLSICHTPRFLLVNNL